MGRHSRDRNAAFDRLFDLHHEAVQIYCLRRLLPDDVNDAVAEVFLVAWQRIDQMSVGKELPWLYAISRNVVRNTWRSRRRQDNLRAKVAGLQDEQASEPETQLVQHHQDRAVLDALATLSLDDQEVLRLKTWEELSNGDIAEVLNASVHAVDMRISRARKRLARAYEQSLRRSATAAAIPRFEERGSEQ